jgi:uncharacterized membrane protein YtjA (UPF0391 family)
LYRARSALLASACFLLTPLFARRPDGSPDANQQERKAMMHYAVVFFVIALVAAVFGFGGIAAGAAGAAKILFFVALALAVVSFFARGRAST